MATLSLLAAASCAAMLAVSCATPADPPPRAQSFEARALPAAPVARSTRASSQAAITFPGGDLTDMLRFALEHNPEMRAAHAHWSALAERIEQAETLPDPTVTFGEFLEELETRAGPQRRRLGLSQSFPWPGTLAARARVAERRAHAAWYALDAKRLAIVEDVTRAYHEYAFGGRELEIRRELLELLSGLEPLVQGRVRTGGPQAQLLRLQVEIGALEDVVASVDARLPVLAARLADALGVPSSAGLLDPPKLAVPSDIVVDLEALRARLHDRNPALHALDAEWSAARAAEELADLRGSPNFTVGVDYLDTGAAINPGTPDSGDDPLLLRVGMTIPIWRSSVAAGRREARLSSAAAHERVADAESRLATELAAAAFAVEDALRRVELYRGALVPRARSSLSLTAASYRAGTSTVVDLLDAERVVLEFELSSWRACRDAFVGAARLTTLTGGEP